MGFVLGIHGPAEAGKDSIADYLIERHGWAGKLSFARNLKNLCKKVFNLTEYQVADQVGKAIDFEEPLELTRSRLGSILYWMSLTHGSAPIDKDAKDKVNNLVGTILTSPRHVLQLVGTEICRELISTYHVDIVRRDTERPGKWAITDVRFINEAEFIQSLGGIVIKVERENLPSRKINRTHASETALSDWNGFVWTIKNNAEGLEHLYAEVDRFLEGVKQCLPITQLNADGGANTSPLMGTETLSGT